LGREERTKVEAQSAEGEGRAARTAANQQEPPPNARSFAANASAPLRTVRATSGS